MIAAAREGSRTASARAARRPNSYGSGPPTEIGTRTASFQVRVVQVTRLALRSKPLGNHPPGNLDIFSSGTLARAAWTGASLSVPSRAADPNGKQVGPPSECVCRAGGTVSESETSLPWAGRVAAGTLTVFKFGALSLPVSRIVKPPRGPITTASDYCDPRVWRRKAFDMRHTARASSFSAGGLFFPRKKK